jgi:outer membrane protein assembly factor BamE (lipoprotein component of BamABCDE complex)
VDKSYGEIWSYRTARVEFQNGKVSAWRNSPFAKLNVELVPKNSDMVSAARARDDYTLGSTRDEVLAVEGTPDTLDKDHEETWWFGTSRIEFSEGKVSSWRDSPGGRTLKIHLSPHPTPAAQAASQRGSYGGNATKDEVLAVEGTPTTLDRGYGETWWYGASRIEFHDGRIADYRNSPGGRQLKLQLGADTRQSDEGPGQPTATVDGFMASIIKAMEKGADDVCACSTLACAQHVADEAGKRGFAAGYAYTKDKDPTPELTKLLSTVFTGTNNSQFTDYLKQNRSEWFSGFKVRFDACVARLRDK